MTMYLCTHFARYMRATDIICLYVVRLYTLSSHSVHFMRSELRARAKIFFSYLAPIKKQHISALIQFTMYHSMYNVCCTYYLHILSVLLYRYIWWWCCCCCWFSCSPNTSSETVQNMCLFNFLFYFIFFFLYFYVMHKCRRMSSMCLAYVIDSKLIHNSTICFRWVFAIRLFAFRLHWFDWLLPLSFASWQSLKSQYTRALPDHMFNYWLSTIVNITHNTEFVIAISHTSIEKQQYSYFIYSWIFTFLLA